MDKILKIFKTGNFYFYPAFTAVIFLQEKFMFFSSSMQQYLFFLVIAAFIMVTSRASFYNYLALALLLLAFLPHMFLPNLGLIIIVLIWFIYQLKNKERIETDKKFILLSSAFIIWAVLSWIYNNLYFEKDEWGLIFWLTTFLFPFIIYVFIYNFKKIDLAFLENRYLQIVLLESILVFIRALVRQKILLKDLALGTCFNAHVLSVHLIFCVFILIHQLIRKYQETKKADHFLLVNLVWFNLIIISASAKFQTIIYGIILFLLILWLIFKLVRFNFKTALLTGTIFLLLSGIFILLAYKDFRKNIGQVCRGFEMTDTLGPNKTAGKFFAYRLLFTALPRDRDLNMLFGTGPAKYTSKASRMRMPSIADSRLPLLKLKEGKWTIFQRYIYQNFYTGPKNFREYSWGTFNSPMTTMNSVIVELGIGGIILFLFLLFYLGKRISRILRANFYLMPIYLFFIIDLFYLNYWEDPFMTIPVFLLMSGNFIEKNPSK